MARSFGEAALALLALFCGCTSRTRITVTTPLPSGTDPAIFVTAARQKDPVLRALKDAGFHIVDAPGPDVYLMRVTLGVDQWSRPCGTLNNVRFSLRQQQLTLIDAEAKGWTGTCQPNVFDEVSRALRTRVLAFTEGGRDEGIAR